MNKFDKVLEKVSCGINLSELDLVSINNSVNDFKKKFSDRLKKLRIDADVFVGGSFAKKTFVKKDKYDVDIFIRFDKKYDDGDISNLTGKVLKKFRKVSRVKGSREYFRVYMSKDFFIEVVPVKKVRGSSNYENITDLSFSHVRYINRKVKRDGILNDIRIAKSFCEANECYGAESYINGFSGYCLELLIYYYGGFLKFIRAMAKVDIDKKLIIDIEKLHKNKSLILMDLNSSKLESPIILIDPTFKLRNVAAALSDKTFLKFQKICKDFLKNPSEKFFDKKIIDLDKERIKAEKNKMEFVGVRIWTKKQEGDIAGSKLLKFYEHLINEGGKFFTIKNKVFIYDNKKDAKLYFIVSGIKKFLINGPLINDKKNVLKFKGKHKGVSVKNGKLFVEKKLKINFKEFLNIWKKKNKIKIKEMYIRKIKIY